MSDAYREFLARKLLVAPPVGIDVAPELSSKLFPFQREIVGLSLRRGRSAIFADTGLGKGWMALEWCRVVAEHTQRPVLLLAPLAVSHQFAREAGKFGVPVTLCASREDVRPGINITNHHKLHKFDPSAFGGVACDEASVLKDFNSATRNLLIEAFATTPYKLSLTATPAPNDHTELGNQAQFLGVMSRTEMLSMFFVHDGGSTQDWRIKGHAQDAFWRWVASWAVMLRKPSDIGHEDGAYDLPPLHYHHHVVPVDQAETFARGLLFAEDATTLHEQRAARRASLEKRVARCAEIAKGTDEPVVIWCDLNDEGDALEKAIPDAVQVAGSDSDDDKEDRLNAFADGRARVLVTKSKIAGHGLNWQHCARVIYCGVTHSFEGFYQSVRRCWRFGQTRPVYVHVVTSEADGRVIENLRRKQDEAAHMGDAMVAAMAGFTREELRKTGRTHDAYEPKKAMRIPQWILDNVEAA